MGGGGGGGEGVVKGCDCTTKLWEKSKERRSQKLKGVLRLLSCKCKKDA